MDCYYIWFSVSCGVGYSRDDASHSKKPCDNGYNLFGVFCNNIRLLGWIRLSDYFCKKISEIGIDTAFLITGGGAMHLNDAITRNKLIKSYFLHHEQSLTMAAEGFYRAINKIALVNVTTGPGAINALNGVFGAFVDSIPMFIISGQVKTNTMLQIKNKNLRQLGDQEVNLYSLAKPLVKYIATPLNHQEAIIAFKRCLFFLSLSSITIFSELFNMFLQLSISLSIIFILSFRFTDSFLIF